jgi:ATP-dependent Zn protease
MAKRRKYQWLYLLAYSLFFALMWYSLRLSLTAQGPKQVPYSEFLNEVRASDVSEVRIDQTVLVAELKPDALKKDEPHEISTERLPEWIKALY